jgi:hypothetical protein
MPIDSPEASGPRKRKLSTKVITNGDPVVERKKKKLETKKQNKKPAPTKKLARAPANTTTKPAAKLAPAPRPSIEDEDEADCRTSIPPRNPKNILEASDGSDDGSDDDLDITPPQKSTKKPVVTKRHPSVEVEEVFDNRSDRDDDEDVAPDGNKDSDSESEGASEAPEEESDEAELGM